MVEHDPSVIELWKLESQLRIALHNLSVCKLRVSEWEESITLIEKKIDVLKQGVVPL